MRTHPNLDSAACTQLASRFLTWLNTELSRSRAAPSGGALMPRVSRAEVMRARWVEPCE